MAYGLFTLFLPLPAGAIPQLALRTHDPSKYIGIVGVSISGGTYSFLIRTQGGPVAFDWYVFTIPTHIAPSTTGMKVWRPSDGRLVFDTGMKWMRVAGQIIGGAGGGQLDPSRSYAIAFAGASVSQSRQCISNPETQPAQVDQYTYIPGVRVLNGVFSSIDMTVFAQQSPPGVLPDIGYISNGLLQRWRWISRATDKAVFLPTFLIPNILPECDVPARAFKVLCREAALAALVAGGGARGYACRLLP